MANIARRGSVYLAPVTSFSTPSGAYQKLVIVRDALRVSQEQAHGEIAGRECVA